MQEHRKRARACISLKYILPFLSGEHVYCNRFSTTVHAHAFSCLILLVAIRLCGCIRANDSLWGALFTALTMGLALPSATSIRSRLTPRNSLLHPKIGTRRLGGPGCRAWPEWTCAAASLWCCWMAGRGNPARRLTAGACRQCLRSPV